MRGCVFCAPAARQRCGNSTVRLRQHMSSAHRRLGRKLHPLLHPVALTGRAVCLCSSCRPTEGEASVRGTAGAVGLRAPHQAYRELLRANRDEPAGYRAAEVHWRGGERFHDADCHVRP
ncbi:conserved hypothetical protein [Leishmania braziliensis MHOM/BR/75/M2904]|uniref:Uncharacterized protein n=1 Tax=Leishmania braziliensis TaxID=5660 RepID=E9AIQ5_LEIBR|nr:conserved hypothetical protein [Leishmania braziliensis MHOM/BR/75/M2904]CAJ2472738.1 unnamed protein product [Leishmania braziliensis]CBZ14704.1 conserved hypothetical protein [Leishmania braziliensis MHOM/BR/75/M2904]